MTEQAPRAHSQYDGQRWHVEFRMHLDLDSPHQAYVVAAVSKKIPLGEHHTWIDQESYAWLDGELPIPEAGACWHNYMLARLEQFRGWLMAEHLASAQDHKDTAIRTELGVSIPGPREEAG